MLPPRGGIFSVHMNQPKRDNPGILHEYVYESTVATPLAFGVVSEPAANASLC